MKKLFICLIAGVMLILLAGCGGGETYEKNIYHSKWKSSDGYILIINDPEKNSKISNPLCLVEVGERQEGNCGVSFNKENGTLTLTWNNYVGDFDSATVSKDTTEIKLGSRTYKWVGNIG